MMDLRDEWTLPEEVSVKSARECIFRRNLGTHRACGVRRLRAQQNCSKPKPVTLADIHLKEVDA